MDALNSGRRKWADFIREGIIIVYRTLSQFRSLTLTLTINPNPNPKS